MSHRLPLADFQFIADFAAFARSKGDEPYTFIMASQCALAQFGIPGVASFDLKGVPMEAYDAAGVHPYTFSALADRLEALLIDAPAVHAEQPC